MEKSVCHPFDYEHLLGRCANDLLQTDAPYAFSQKQLKYLRPVIEAILNRKMSQDPTVRPLLEKVLHNHLKNPAALTELKWKTLCHEIMMQNDSDLMEMWVDSRSNGWEILSTAPTSSNHIFKDIVAAVIPNLIKSGKHQKLSMLTKCWTTNEKKLIAERCAPLHKSSNFMVDVLAMLGTAPAPSQRSEIFNISQKTADVFPEYFLDQVERILKDFSQERTILSTVESCLPPQVLSLMSLPQATANHEGIRQAFQYFKLLPNDLQNATLEKIKASSYAKDLWETSLEFKSFVEKTAIDEALENTKPNLIRRAKI